MLAFNKTFDEPLDVKFIVLCIEEPAAAAAERGTFLETLATLLNVKNHIIMTYYYTTLVNHLSCNVIHRFDECL